MARVYYDLHLHSCLSPCADLDMTPCNLVNMAKLMGFDLIALTDHNSCGNCAAAMKVGEAVGLTVIPGMELCTAEEAHVVCLFPTLEDAMGFHRYVQAHGPHILNEAGIFGRQVLMDEHDVEQGEEEALLVVASDISVNHVVALTRRYHGTAFPAHVDRESYSVISSLGVIPEEAGFSAVEISPRGDMERVQALHPELAGKILLKNSDAHRLEHMREPASWLELPENTPAGLIAALNGAYPVAWHRE